MSLNDIVTVSISAQTTTPTQLGFGVPLIARAHNVVVDVVAEYKTLAEMTTAGWAATDPAVLIATKVAAQNPRPKSWKIGKRVNTFSQDVTFTPINTTQGYVYSFDIVVGATTTTITYTNGPAETVATIVTALTALITAVAGITATDNTTDVGIATDTAGDLVDYVGVSDEPANFQFKDDTPDPGLATDLTAIEVVDPDGWYALLLDSQSEAEILAAAAWIESRKKILLCNTSDTEVVDNAVTTDVMSDLQSFSYARTGIIYSQARLLNWSGAAWAGNRLPSAPGSSTWAFKTLASVQVDSKLTGGQVSVIESKGGNVYRTIAGVNVSTFGITPEGEFIDVTRTIDWIDQRIKERIFGVLANNAKIPYTDAGVDVIRSEVLAQLNQGVTAGALAADPAPTVTAPLVADISTTNRANRLLPDIFFQARIAGAIHTVDITGVLSV